MINRTYSILLIALLLIGVTLSACDNSGDRVSDEALSDFSTMMSNTFSLFSLLSFELAPASTAPKAEPAADVYTCPNGGEVSYDVTNVGGSNNEISYVMDFNDCNGLNGSLQYDIGGEFTEQTLSIDITINGNIVESCDVTFSQFNEKVLADFTAEPAAFTFSLNGEISSTCRNESFSCMFENDSFDTTESPDASLFENRCTLN